MPLLNTASPMSCSPNAGWMPPVSRPRSGRGWAESRFAKPYLGYFNPTWPERFGQVIACSVFITCHYCVFIGSSEAFDAPRSEEHTSELQSRGHLVCRLLLEKKK